MSKNNDVVIINIGGRDRELRFGHKALKTFHAISGISIEKIPNRGVDPDMIEKLVYCGLLRDAKEHGETITIEEVEDWLDDAPNYNDVVNKMSLALGNSFGKAETDPNSQTTAVKKK